MHTDKLVFSLRIALRGGIYLEEDIRKAMEYALQAGYDDICLFTPGEEASRGYCTPAELDEWMVGARLLKEKALQAGLSFSVNPWNTLSHEDRGRTLREGQNFTTMVDMEGNPAAVVACPLCENWRAWLLETYTTIARELQPYILWVEDDFRLHNHSPLAWGGCFCALHMDEYSRRAGKTLTRQAFAKGMLAPGTPTPLRQVWLETHRDTWVEIARLLEQAVHTVAPATRIGLMSSVPETHAVEGRDWRKLLRAFSGENLPPVDRIHLPAYAELWPAEYMRLFNQISLHTRACLPPETEILPELENFTFSRFIKSDAFTRFQLEAAAPLGLGGMAIDVFDIGGGGIFPQDGAMQAIKNARGFIQQLNQTGVFGWQPGGVKVLTRTNSAAFTHTRQGESPQELQPEETFWAGLLGTFSIPFHYGVNCLPQNSICAVSGQFFRSLSTQEITALFAQNAVLLNGDAAAVLCEMGLGHLAGIRSCRQIAMSTGVASYEQAARSYFGVSGARCSAQCMTGDYFHIEYEGETEELSGIYNPFNEQTGPGVVVRNKRVAVLPYGNFGPYIRSHFHPVRAALVADALKLMGLPLLVENARNLFVYQYTKGSTTALYLVNAQNDPCDTLTLYTQGAAITSAEILTAAQGRHALPHTANTVQVSLAPLECALLWLTT